MGKLSDVLGAPMEIIDNLVSESIVRGAYYQNLRRGMSDSEAMHQADIFAAGVMADRSKGALPTLFESSNPLFKAFTQFQVEVNNQYSELFKDVPREYAGKAKWMLAACLFKYFIGACLWNKFEEEVRGRASAMDPIGIAEDFIDDFRSVGLADAGANLATNLIEELPFTSALSLLGFDIDGGRIPIASAMPDIPKLWESMTDRDMNRKQRWKNFTDEIQKPITYLLMPAGGGQAAKIWKGIDAYIQGGSYSVNGEGEDILQYPVYKDDGGDAFWSLVRSTIFGKSSLPEAQEWVKDGFDSLNAKQTAIYQDMLEAGAKDREAYTLIDELRRAPGTEAGEKRFNQLDILKKTAVSDEHKAIAYYGMVASQSERELMNALTEAGSGMDIVDFVAEFSDAKKLKGTARKEALRDALKRSTLTEAEKQIAIGDILGTEQTSASGNLTQYGKFIYAKKYGLTADEFMDMYAKGIDIDDYIDLREQDVSNDGASDLAGILGQLELSDISSTEKWNRQCEAILAADVTEEEKVTALVNVSSGSTARMLRVGYDYGISPDLCISFRKILPKFDNGNGNYSQKEVQAAIDALSGNEAYLAATGGKAALTIEQKAILWQLYNTSWKYWKNPYSSEVGRFIYELMQAEKNAPAQKEQESSGTFEEAIMEQWRQK